MNQPIASGIVPHSLVESHPPSLERSEIAIVVELLDGEHTNDE